MRGNVLSVAMGYFLLKRIKHERDRLAASDAVPTIGPDAVGDWSASRSLT